MKKISWATTGQGTNFDFLYAVDVDPATDDMWATGRAYAFHINLTLMLMIFSFGTWPG